jgi:very-short-patch-repair endonuclease
MTERVPKFIVELARENRKNATKAEQFAWLKLRNRKYRGYKFNRQFPLIYSWNEHNIGFYIADFHCFELKLIIEIDGGYHKTQKELDGWRDEVVSELGYKTLRITNEDVAHMYTLIDKFIA